MANIDDSAAEPGAIPADVTQAGNPAGDGWFGHPAQLKRLFTTEMWERFGYYGMRAILTLYLANFFLFSDTTTAGLYGGFTALVYLTPLVGGLLADNYLGSKRSVKFGAILMSIGYAVLCFSGTGDAAKPYALIDDKKIEITVEGKGDAAAKYVSVDGQKLKIQGNEDKTVSLLAADGKEVRKFEEGKFKSDGERSGFAVLLLLVGLSTVTIGNGFFKPNISTIVGSLYQDGDRRRDAGFTIFYMGINLGSLISQFFCPILAQSVGFWAGFALAAIGMACSWLLIQFDGGRLDGYGDRPANADATKDWPIYIGALLCVPIVWFLFSNLMNYVKPEEGTGIIGYVMGLPIMGKALFLTFLFGVPAILIWSYFKGSRKEFQMMVAAMVLIVFNVVFWTLFEQAGSSLTLFAERNTVLEIGWTAPLFAMFRSAPVTYYLFFGVVFGGLFYLAWWFFSRGEPAATKRTMAIGFSVVGIATMIGMHIARLKGFGNEAVYLMPAGQTQIFNALFIVLLAPVFGLLWGALSGKLVSPSKAVKLFGSIIIALAFLALIPLLVSLASMTASASGLKLIVFAALSVLALAIWIGSAWAWYKQIWTWSAPATLEPGIPVKFAIALMGVGAGFLFLVFGAQFVGNEFKVGMAWLAGLYLIHSVAELCISPVGLSMVTKLSIARIVGMMMGVWFLSIAVAQYFAGMIAQVASVETVGGQVTNLKVSLETYTGVFTTIGEVSIGVGVLLLILSPLLKRWMHGVT